MDETVSPFFGAPIVVRTGRYSFYNAVIQRLPFEVAPFQIYRCIDLFLFTGLLSPRFTAVAVDPQIMTTEGKTYDVIFIGKFYKVKI